MSFQDITATATTHAAAHEEPVKVSVRRIGDSITVYMDNADNDDVTTAYLYLDLDAARALVSELRIVTR